LEKFADDDDDDDGMASDSCLLKEKEEKKIPFALPEKRSIILPHKDGHYQSVDPKYHISVRRTPLCS
jgi:hypothetical protein